MSTKTEALPIVAHIEHHKGGDNLQWDQPGGKFTPLTYLTQATDRISELEAEVERLLEKAQAVVDRWDTPLWKDVPPTAEFIGALRAAIDQARQAQKGRA